MGKTKETAVGDDQIAVYSPQGVHLYDVSTSDARVMIKERAAQRMTPFAIRLKTVKELPMPVPFVYRQMLPNDQQATCWCWSLKPIRSRDEDLFNIAVRSLLPATPYRKEHHSRVFMDDIASLDREMSVDREIAKPIGERLTVGFAAMTGSEQALSETAAQ